MLDRYGNNWNRAELEEFARSVESLYGIPAGGLSALIAQESAWNPQAESPVGAQGLAQFMPPTAEEWDVDPWDPLQSIEGAGKYLAWLRSQLPSWTAALAAYNYGIGNVKRRITEAGHVDISRLPKETRDYIAKLAPAFGEDPSGLSPAGVQVSPLLIAAGAAIVWWGVS